eukprot:TRINITY_DN25473_c0_g1_i1.p1 TRINITY_DN25473_c0_g1~~TRINITY_DN25473_c0_g1_i1.p1  ORF type:complete len:502 (-),score=81.79 TRINITY_DN25473_c0_g1_i1:43-1548(-)
MATEVLLLGIDVGTYSSKGVLVRLDGTLIAQHTVPHEMLVPRPGWAEQDAEAVWWNDVRVIINELLHAVSAGSIAAVCCSAIGPCMLPLDDCGRPLRNGILYGVDTRATVEITELEAALGKDTIYDLAGMHLTSQAVAPKILWLRKHDTESWKRLATVTTASSFLTYRLTGRHVMDKHTASHFVPLLGADFQWSTRFQEHILPLDKLPAVDWCDALAGRVSAEAAAVTGLPEGTPVAVGGVDALSEAISAGAVEPGDLMIMYGSTTFFILVLPEKIPAGDTAWLTAGAFEGQSNWAAGMATTGSLTRWFCDEFAPDLGEVGWAYTSLFQQAAAIPVGCSGLLVLPYFSGERTPINDPKARGVIAGLTLSHTRAHVFRAVLEGVAFGIRHNIEAFRKRGAEIKRVVAVGGGAQTDTWLQIVSDVTGLVQEVPSVTIGASYGDAFLAGVASGLLQRADIAKWARIERTIRPNAEHKDAYDTLYAQYIDLYEATKGVMHSLSEI